MAEPLLARIAAGAFTMGHADIAEAEAPNPPHVVELSEFRLGVHPVTNAEYAAFVAVAGVPTPKTLGGPRHPVVGVSYVDALAYCTWAGGTLPSEAQWERAARGPHDDGRRYPWGDAEPSDALASFAEDWNSGGPSAVGLHTAGASPFGCQDLAGNVWEWCLDSFETNAHQLRQGRDPVLSAAHRVRPLRGGCWRSIDCKLQISYRNWTHEVARHSTIGFRLCVT
jgi:formylglycine-generating enzyme required for sulfatase activity